MLRAWSMQEVSGKGEFEILGFFYRRIWSRKQASFVKQEFELQLKRIGRIFVALQSYKKWRKVEIRGFLV